MAADNLVRLERYAGNPILTANPEHRWEDYHVSNSGATIYKGKIYIAYRASSLDKKSPGNAWGISRIGLAISSNGVDIDERRPEPLIDLVGEDDYLLGPNGVEDPRITKIGDTYYIVYATTSLRGDRIALATTKDFKTVEKHGLLMGHFEQRTAGLFPEKINGKFILMHRLAPNIWISESEDLKTFTNTRLVMDTHILPWCEVKMGLSAPPIRTRNAWALIFHGRDRHRCYRQGIAWLDLEEPWKVIKVQQEPILEPVEPYEATEGFIPNCVYACGAVELNDTVFVYYGASDTVACVATMPREMLELP